MVLHQRKVLDLFKKKIGSKAKPILFEIDFYIYCKCSHSK